MAMSFETPDNTPPGMSAGNWRCALRRKGHTRTCVRTIPTETQPRLCVRCRSPDLFLSALALERTVASRRSLFLDQDCDGNLLCAPSGIALFCAGSND